MEIVWTNRLATGIDVIDNQHRRIVDYINELNNMSEQDNHGSFRELLFNMLDYTQSHFIFEESLMDEAGFEASSIHKTTHDAFRNKIDSLIKRFEAGEDIYEEVRQMLNTWLIDHISDDDNSYVPHVKAKFPGLNTGEKKSWIESKIGDIFK